MWSQHSLTPLVITADEWVIVSRFVLTGHITTSNTTGALITAASSESRDQGEARGRRQLMFPSSQNSFAPMPATEVLAYRPIGQSPRNDCVAML